MSETSVALDNLHGQMKSLSLRQESSEQTTKNCENLFLTYVYYYPSILSFCLFDFDVSPKFQILSDKEKDEVY
ncbi:hypothetical protein L2E82_32632 [Cichorium intybus]|uniref:Uncharacterized protein n=1 Tax=Cichorium intybus TaxID=13427 RepID=A0ACB9BID8_CICIN|nr:hypothetical protein L2E82_32632 [Cichorium intybus]